MDSPHDLRARAERYRRLVSTVTDAQALDALRELATRYEAMAAALEASGQLQSSDLSRE